MKVTPNAAGGTEGSAHWWSRQLAGIDIVQSRWGPNIRVDLLCQPKAVRDDPLKLLIRGRRETRPGVAICASADGPDLPLHAFQKICAIRHSLHAHLAEAIIQPIGYAEVKGRSVLLLPYHRSFSTKRSLRCWDRWRLQAPVLDWLQKAVKSTARMTSDEELTAKFELPLVSLTTAPAVSNLVAQEAGRALARLNSAKWRPRTSFMHGDFWVDNLLRGAVLESGWGFVIIDWAGASPSGYPFYDLVRMSESLRVRPARLGEELAHMADALECDVQDAAGYQLACLGWLRSRLGAFPINRYHELVERVSHRLRSAIVKRE